MALQEADYGLTDFAMGDNVQGNPRYRNDDQLLVKFFNKPVLNHDKSKEEGRPCYEDAAHIEISRPGDRGSKLTRPAREVDKQRFSRHYQAFVERKEEEHLEGTPLEEWPLVGRSTVEELRYFKIRTVEHLANAGIQACQKMAGMQQLKDKAVAWLEAAEGTAAAEKLVAQEKMMAELQEELDKARALNEALEERLLETEEED